MFSSDTLTMCQGSPIAFFTHGIRRWLHFGSFALACVLLGNSILPLCPSSLFPNSGHYPEFPFIHLSLLLFLSMLSSGAFVLLYFPSHSFFLWKLTFLKFLALLSPSGQVCVLPWATAASLGHSRNRTVVPWGRDHNHLENNFLFVQPPVQLQTWGQHCSPCVSLIIFTGVFSYFLTSWLLQSSPQNWDVPQFRGSSFHNPSQGMWGTADWWLMATATHVRTRSKLKAPLKTGETDVHKAHTPHH